MDLLEGARLFLRIAEHGSLRATARHLGISAAAVSRRLDALERDLGATLLARTTRRLTLTDAGERFLREASRLLSAEREARASVSPEHGLAGRLVVSCSVTFGLLELTDAVRPLLASHPALELELRFEDRISDLLDEGVDVAIRGGEPLAPSDEIIARRLRTFERWVVAAPRYLRRAGAPKRVEELRQHTFLGGGAFARGALRYREGGEERTLALERRVHTRTLLAVRQLAVAGAGVAVLPQLAIGEDVAARRLRRVLKRVELAPASLFVVYRVERRGDPAIAALLTALRAGPG